MKIGISLPVREMKDDLMAIKDFAVAAEELGYTHLRIPDQVLRPGNNHLHEPLTLLAWVAGFTKKIELVASVIVAPARQTVLLAKQAAQIDLLSQGRLRLGIGVGANREEFRYLAENFENRGKRCSEQIKILKELWSKEEVNFEGTWHRIEKAGLNPLPIQRPIPIWIGAQANPVEAVVERIGTLADGWFVLCDPKEFASLDKKVKAHAEAVGRDSASIQTEAGVAVVGPREKEWESRVRVWKELGLTHICLRTLGANLEASAHIEKLKEILPKIPR